MWFFFDEIRFEAGGSIAREPIQYKPLIAVPPLAERGKALRPLEKTSHPGHGVVQARTLPEAVPKVLIRPAISFYTNCDAPVGTSTSSGGTSSLRNVSLNLLFWGSFWNGTPSPPVSQIISSVYNILDGPYMSGLIQYGVGPGKFAGAGIVTGVEPNNPFSDDDVTNILSDLLNQGLIPGYGPEDLYMVILPANIAYNKPPFTGEHLYYDTFPARRFCYGFVTHNGSINSLTPIFSHELAEAVSDPDGDGIQVNPRNSSSWNEICDVCCSTYPVNGVLVQSYWSSRDHACVIPTSIVPASGGSLACFGLDGAFSRVYYLDTNDNVNELAWARGWGFGDPLTGTAGGAAYAPPAASGSSLACFGVNSSAPRVYYFRSGISIDLNTADVFELYWDNGWGYNQLSGLGGKAAGRPLR